MIQIVLLKLIVLMECMYNKQELVSFGTGHLPAAICFLVACLCPFNSFRRMESCFKALTSWLKECRDGNLQVIRLQ